MNLKFNKALYLLDRGKYKEAEKNLCMAIDECNNPMELLEIKSCYAEFLHEMKRYEESMAYVNYILEHTDEYEDSFPRETAVEIKKSIEGDSMLGELIKKMEDNIDSDDFERIEEECIEKIEELDLGTGRKFGKPDTQNYANG